MPPMALTGVVTKVGFMQKTATVTVSRYMVHRKTHKRIERSKKYLTHDADNTLKLGDTVLIRNCPPISARKRFRLEKIIKSPETEWQQVHGDVISSVNGEGTSKSSLGPEKNSTSGKLLAMLGRSSSKIKQGSTAPIGHGEGEFQSPLVPEDKPISGGIAA